MGQPRPFRRSGVPTLLVALALGACWGSEEVGRMTDTGDRGGEPVDGVAEAATRGDQAAGPTSGPSDLPRAPRDSAELPLDWELFREKVTWAWDHGLDTLPMGDAMARLGETFVGTDYKPHTLEVPGPERVVVNLQAMDCVTFVENVLALVTFVKGADAAIMDDTAAYRSRYRELLQAIRYRDGRVAGYPSRLHYFSEWMGDNEARGRVRLVAREMGGVPDAEVIDFMSSHPDSYRQLVEDPAHVERIREIEERLSADPRYYIPQERVVEVQNGLRNGDIIAATSTVPGLDIAHTGLVLVREGVPHLLHAPLVGEEVQVSEVSIGERLLGLSRQDGIMVARPVERAR